MRNSGIRLPDPVIGSDSKDENWPIIRFSELFDVKHGYAFQSQFFGPEGRYVLLTPGSFHEEGGYRDQGDKQKMYSGDVPEGFVLEADDLLVAMTEQAPGLLGSALFIPESGKFLHNQRLGRIVRLDETRLDKRFLYHLFNWSEVRQQISSTAAGTKVRHTSPERIGQVVVPLPPLETQRAIAEMLQTWDRAIGASSHCLRRYNRRLESLATLVFERAYRSGGHLCLATELLNPVSERRSPDLPLLAVTQDVGVVRRDELERRVVMPEGDVSSYKVVHPGDFIISLRSFEGGLEYSGVMGLVSPAYTVLRPKVDLNPDYYRHFFKSQSFIGRLNRLIFGIRDGKQIAFRDFGDMTVPNPPIAEQEKVANLLNSAEEVIQLCRRERDALIAQKRGLMQKLLTGTLRINP